MTAWMKEDSYTVSPYLIPCSQVVVRKTLTVVLHPPQATCDQGINAFTTAPVGRASLCFKHHKAQTDRHLAPGCEDELSGLDPANTSCLLLYGGHTETKGYSGGIELCQLAVKHGIKPPIGSDMHHESQSISCAKEPRRTGSRARSSRRLAVGIATSMGGLDDGKGIRLQVSVHCRITN